MVGVNRLVAEPTGASSCVGGREEEKREGGRRRKGRGKGRGKRRGKGRGGKGGERERRKGMQRVIVGTITLHVHVYNKAKTSIHKANTNTLIITS